MKETIKETTDSENPQLHWKYIECKDQVAIDLGCGRWEHVEYRDQSWPTTPEYLLQLGACKVYAFDIDAKEIEWYKNNLCTRYSNLVAFTSNINSINTIRDIYQQCKPDVVKCDIEGNEKFLLELTDEEFIRVNFYAIETHSDWLYDSFIAKFQKLNYDIIATIDLVHAPPMKALFAKRNIDYGSQ